MNLPLPSACETRPVKQRHHVMTTLDARRLHSVATLVVCHCHDTVTPVARPRLGVDTLAARHHLSANTFAARRHLGANTSDARHHHEIARVTHGHLSARHKIQAGASVVGIAITRGSLRGSPYTMTTIRCTLGVPLPPGTRQAILPPLPPGLPR